MVGYLSLRHLRALDPLLGMRGKGEKMSLFPVRSMLAVFLGVTSIQCLLFGAVFTFRDGMSGQKRDTRIEINVIDDNSFSLRVYFPEKITWIPAAITSIKNTATH